MELSKQQYLEKESEKITQFWLGRVLTLGAVTFFFLAILDYVATPENFSKFIFYRFIMIGVLLSLFFLNRIRTNKYYQSAITIIGTTASALILELMILSYGGHTSSYYAGLNLLIICLLGFVPLSLSVSIMGIVIVYSLYLIPILMFDTITNFPVFFTNNSFMLSTFIIALTLRIISQKRMLSELGLQYDIEQEKHVLRDYSTQLEDLVAERTKELNKSEQWHRSLFENATDGIVVLDKNGIIVNANEKACEMHGFTRNALVGTNIKLLEDNANRDKIAERTRRILKGEALVFETTHNKKDGTPIFLEISSKAITIGDDLFVHSFYRDITEKKKLQEHIFQSQKMDSIGVLAGGIAHDFNNILTAILGHTDIIRRTSMLDIKATNSLGVIEDASRRAGRMISKLLGFARKSKMEIATLNLNDVVYDTIKLVERLLDKNIEMSVELDSYIPFIQGDINHIEQIVMNLIVNARDAMPQGGKLIIKTSRIDVVSGMRNIPNYILPGEYVLLSVMDTGSGIPEIILNKIFEPFFTTKERGKGTGLGLSMVYGAVKEHAGYITVESEVGHGTTFAIFIPALQVEAFAPQSRTGGSVDGTETLLVVDDEIAILRSMLETLTSHGYKAIGMSDSPSALHVFETLPQEIALLITDIGMPNMDGKELITQIKNIKPEVKILAISGQMKYIADKDGIREIDGFLKKPFEPAYLLSVVRRILDMKTKTTPLYS
jgi:PAS domain S-box-containing protein